jgi:PAS domain S-box-containing protein
MLGVRWLVGATIATLAFILGLASLEWAGLFQPTPRPNLLGPATTYFAVIPVIGYLTFAARKALVASRNRAVKLSNDLQRFLDNMPAAVAWFDDKSKLRRCNQRYADLYGKPASEIIGVNLVDYVPELTQQLVRDAGRKVLQGVPQNYRRFHVHPITSEVTWLDVGVTPEVADGRVVGLYTVLVDVTDKVKAEADIRILNDELEARVKRRTDELASAMETLRESRDELVRSQAKAGLSAMVASVSHELSTPVGNSVLVASTFSEMALQLGRQVESGQLRKSTLSELQRTLTEGSEMLQRNLQRAEMLLRNFKQVSADQASEQRRRFDLAEVVAEVVASMAPSLRKAPHQVMLELPAGIQMDSLPGPLGQVIINLINNAYTHALDPQRPGVVTLRAQEQDGQVLLQVEDNGKGMSADVMQRLFEPFFSTRIGEGGTGLGMSIVQSIVSKSLGGSMHVHSTPGQGTRYDITLPRSAPHYIE